MFRSLLYHKMFVNFTCRMYCIYNYCGDVCASCNILLWQKIFRCGFFFFEHRFPFSSGESEWCCAIIVLRNLTRDLGRVFSAHLRGDASARRGIGRPRRVETRTLRLQRHITEGRRMSYAIFPGRRRKKTTPWQKWRLILRAWSPKKPMLSVSMRLPMKTVIPLRILSHAPRMSGTMPTGPFSKTF